MRVSRARTILLAAAFVAWMPAFAPADDAMPPAEDAKAAVGAALAQAADLRQKADFQGALAALKAVDSKYGPSAATQEAAGWVFMDRAVQETAEGTDNFLVRTLYADAMVRGKKALALDPESAGATLLLAQSQRAYGDLAGARDTFLDWLKRHEDSLPVRWAWAQWQFDSQQWAEADRQFTRILGQTPDDGGARLAATISKHWLGVPAEDLERGYLQAAHLLPDDDRPIRYLASVHPNDRAKRLALLEKVIEDNPKAVWARVWMASILWKVEPVDAKRAAKLLREAETLAPGNSTVHFNLAEVLQESGDVLDAVKEFTLTVETGAPGQSGNASRALDLALWNARDDRTIPLSVRERAYKVLCEMNPEVGSYGNNAGLWFRDVGKDYEKSLRFYLLSVKAEPDDQNFLNDTGLIYLFHLTDRVNRCLPLFEKVVRLVEVEREPPVRGYWDTLENLCLYWFEKGEYTKTIEYADKRASPNASIDGSPYPSFKAAALKARAQAELEKAKK